MRNDSFSLKFFLNTEKKGISGQYPIYLRIMVNRRKVELSTKLQVKDKKSWNPDAQRINSKSPINTQLNLIEGKITNLFLELKHTGRDISAIVLKDLYLGRTDKEMTVIAFLDTRAKARFLDNPEYSAASVAIYRTTIMHFKNFLAASNLTHLRLKEINEKIIEKWGDFLSKIELPDKSGTLHRNTISKYHIKVKTILNLAVKDGALVFNPYRDLKIRTVPSTRTFLTDAELKKIETHDLGGNESLQRVKDIFLFSVYTGLRFRDASELKNERIENAGGKYWINIIQQKTKEHLRIPLLEKAVKIVQKYAGQNNLKGFVLPRITNQKVNAYLKVIASLAGIKKKLTHHMARHTTATTIFLANGVPLEVVSRQLGHSSIKSTQIYAKITNDLLSQTADKLNAVLK